MLDAGVFLSWRPFSKYVPSLPGDSNASFPPCLKTIPFWEALRISWLPGYLSITPGILSLGPAIFIKKNFFYLAEFACCLTVWLMKCFPIFYINHLILLLSEIPYWIWDWKKWWLAQSCITSKDRARTFKFRSSKSKPCVLPTGPCCFVTLSFLTGSEWQKKEKGKGV